MKRHDFTLLELVVVLAVMALSATLAVGVFRKDSPAKIMHDTSLGFQEFCARVRFQAMESGEERLIRFLPEEKKFYMALLPGRLDEKNKESEESGENFEEESMEWTLPADFNMQDMEEADEGTITNEDGSLDLFLFLPDGGTSGKRQFIIRYKELSTVFEISALTGRLQVREEETQQ